MLPSQPARTTPLSGIAPAPQADWLGGGYPWLSADTRRNLEKGTRRLTGDDAAAVFTRDPAAIAAQRAEITAARRQRLDDTGRPAGEPQWDATWAQASELATLRIGGQLAAWLLARPADGTYRVLAGQMAGQFRDRRPGRALEAIAAARALAGPLPWPPLPDVIEALLKAVTVRLDGAGYEPCGWLDWGEGHPEALLTAARR